MYAPSLRRDITLLTIPRGFLLPGEVEDEVELCESGAAPKKSASDICRKLGL